jgi:hypothetical protein
MSGKFAPPPMTGKLAVALPKPCYWISPHDLVAVPSSTDSLFNLSVSFVDCQTVVECTVFQAPASSFNCTLQYGTDSSFNDFRQRSLPANGSLPLGGLQDGTMYYIQAIFTSDRPEDQNRFYHLRTTYETGMHVCVILWGCFTNSVINWLESFIILSSSE